MILTLLYFALAFGVLILLCAIGWLLAWLSGWRKERRERVSYTVPYKLERRQE